VGADLLVSQHSSIGKAFPALSITSAVQELSQSKAVGPWESEITDITSGRIYGREIAGAQIEALRNYDYLLTGGMFYP
jgi:hypothetical protein